MKIIRILHTILWVTVLILLMIVTLPLGLYAKFSGKGKPIIQKAIHVVVGIICGVAGVKREVHGKENLPDCPALFAGNHQGYFDVAPMLTDMGPVKSFFAKIAFRKVPIVRLWIENLGCMYIDKDDVRASLRTMQEAEERLKNGESLVIFPEGARSRCREMNDFKPGALRCALKAGVPIVPFVIDGSYKAFEETGWICPTTVKLYILPPIETKGCGLKTQELSNLVQSRIQETLDNTAE
jgi:1-acyl-sn-glycerol-3-phosphate acyltransferase